MNEKQEIKWKSHPVVDEFPKSLLAVFLILLFTFGFTVVFQNVWFGGITFVVLFLAMLSYFLPVHYKMDERSITVQFLFFRNERPLRKFKNYYVNPVGVHFSTFSEPSPLDPFRGTYIRFGRFKDKVLPFIKDIMADRISEDDAE